MTPAGVSSDKGVKARKVMTTRVLHNTMRGLNGAYTRLKEVGPRKNPWGTQSISETRHRASLLAIERLKKHIEATLEMIEDQKRIKEAKKSHDSTANAN